MGLPEGHPDKDGVMVDLKYIVPEVQSRIRKKKEKDDRVNTISASANG